MNRRDFLKKCGLVALAGPAVAVAGKIGAGEIGGYTSTDVIGLEAGDIFTIEGEYTGAGELRRFKNKLISIRPTLEYPYYVIVSDRWFTQGESAIVLKNNRRDLAWVTI